MNLSKISLGLATTLAFVIWGGIQAQEPEFPPKEPPLNLVPDGDIQASGPVHEAFAQPFDVQPEPGPVIPKKPPEPVPELPPEERPEGDDFQWIPGYWAWDSEMNDFLWVSGTYRKTPADRQYVPGYWTETSEGWRWVPGYWASTSQPEVEYVPEPPASLENGPSVPGPEDSIYIPGYWSYQNTSFAWRPGFWSPGYTGRIWNPPCYRWTPGGHVFVNGYWDYPFDDRGLLFAPVHFSRPYWQQAGYFYRPRYTLGTGLLLDFLFYRPRYCHFYFGNYFGPRYGGYRPWYAAPHSPYANYYRWNNRNNPNWYAGMRQNYSARAAGNLPVPPRTLTQQNVALKNISNSNISITQVVTPLNKLNQQNIRLTKVGSNQLETQKASIQRTRELAQQRQQFESKAGPLAKGPSGGPVTRTFKLPQGPQKNNSGPNPGFRQDPGVKGPGSIAAKGPAFSSPLNREGNLSPRDGQGGKDRFPEIRNNPPFKAPIAGTNPSPKGAGPQVITPFGNGPKVIPPKAGTAGNAPFPREPGPQKFTPSNNGPKVVPFAKEGSSNPSQPRGFPSGPKVENNPPAVRSTPKFASPNPGPNGSSFQPKGNGSSLPRITSPAPKVSPGPAQPRSSVGGGPFLSSPGPKAFSSKAPSFNKGPSANSQPRSSPAPRVSSAPSGRSAPAANRSAPKAKGKR
jgi:hypothetical protein